MSDTQNIQKYQDHETKLTNKYLTKNRITILGCGCSYGTPALGCDCEVCTSPILKNKRRRSSIFIQYNVHLQEQYQINILIDCGPDIKDQLTSLNPSHIDAILITHRHHDHLIGLNELRSYQLNKKSAKNKSIKLYTTKDVIDHLEDIFPYMFRGSNSQLSLQLEEIEYYSNLIDCKEIKTFLLYHDIRAGINTLGVKIENIIYANDFIKIPVESEGYFEQATTVIIDCKEIHDTAIHIGLETVMKMNDSILKGKNVFLTNLSHKLEFSHLCDTLPSNIRPCFDMMQLEF